MTHTHVSRSDTEPEIAYGESEEGPGSNEENINASGEENMHAWDERTSSHQPRHTVHQHVRPFLFSTSEMPSFFNKVFGEVIPDSIGVPHEMRTSYYDPNKGDLSI